MAKPSRSKQPEFDPRELEDLIFTPAVGSGVGSHLLRPDSEPSGLISAKTVLEGLAKTIEDTHQTTVVTLKSTTVVDQRSSYPTTSNQSNIVDGATEVASKATTVGRSLWATESGEIVPEARVRRIRLAQDVLNSAEESVYDTLWNAKNTLKGDGDTYRITQAGYDYLMKRTRLSKKTIQRIIDRLTHKDFIVIERPADIYNRTSTTYRVFSYRTVLDRLADKGRFHAVKIGPGFLFAHRLDIPSNLTTVGISSQSTVVNMTTPTVVETDLTTVVPRTTKEIEQSSRGRYSSSEISSLKQLLLLSLGAIDDDAVAKLLQECRSRAGDCTPEEIAFFVSQKLRAVRNIQNPVGFMLTAIPKHFEARGHLPLKDLLRRQAERRAQEWRDACAFWSKILEDPDSSPEERDQAESVLRDLRSAPGDVH